MVDQNRNEVNIDIEQLLRQQQEELRNLEQQIRQRAEELRNIQQQLLAHPPQQQGVDEVDGQRHAQGAVGNAPHHVQGPSGSRIPIPVDRPRESSSSSDSSDTTIHHRTPQSQREAADRLSKGLPSTPTGRPPRKAAKASIEKTKEMAKNKEI